MIKIIYPPLKPEKNDKVIFLAGPMIGSSIWREEMISLFNKNNIDNKDFTIASPQKMTKNKIELLSDLTDEEFVDQVEWEETYMLDSALNGILIFWLGKEIIKVNNRCFAQTTRFEIGEWYAKSFMYPTSILVGYDESFPGLSYIKTRFLKNKEFYPFFNNMEELVKFALENI